MKKQGLFVICLLFIAIYPFAFFRSVGSGGWEGTEKPFFSFLGILLGKCILWHCQVQKGKVQSGEIEIRGNGTRGV